MSEGNKLNGASWIYAVREGAKTPVFRREIHLEKEVEKATISIKQEYNRVLANLLEDIRLKEGHLTGGDVGHPFTLRALEKCGCSNVIAKILMKRDFPGYGFQVDCGATTLCEDWDGPNTEHPVMSQNHFMLGGAEEWFYHYLAGIKVKLILNGHIEEISDHGEVIRNIVS